MSNFKVPSSWNIQRSPNYSQRKKKVTAIVLHADASSRIESSLTWTRRAESKVSYHILIGRTGKIYMTVHPDDKAWHAGVSSFLGEKNVNEFSVGVCLSNRNDGEVFPPSQLETAYEVCVILCKHYSIPVERITTHAAIAPNRKTDPLGLDLQKFQDVVQAKLR